MALGVIAVIWLVILPALTQWPTVRARIARHQSLDINPSAVFYSDNEAVSRALIGIESAHRRREAAWWRPHQQSGRAQR